MSTMMTYLYIRPTLSRQWHHWGKIFLSFFLGFFLTWWSPTIYECLLLCKAVKRRWVTGINTLTQHWGSCAYICNGGILPPPSSFCPSVCFWMGHENCVCEWEGVRMYSVLLTALSWLGCGQLMLLTASCCFAVLPGARGGTNTPIHSHPVLFLTGQSTYAWVRIHM